MFFVPCPPIEDNQGHFQCHHLEFIKLSSHSAINVKEYRDQHLVGLRDQLLVGLKIASTCVDISNMCQFVWWWCNWIWRSIRVFPKQPIIILKPRINKKALDKISCMSAIHIDFGLGVGQNPLNRGSILFAHVVPFFELLHYSFPRSEVF